MTNASYYSYIMEWDQCPQDGRDSISSICAQMAQLLFKLSNLSRRNRNRNPSLSRMFSSNPCLILGCSEAERGTNIGNVSLFDAAKQEILTVSDKTVPQEMFTAKGFGASHGWSLFSAQRHPSVYLTDLFSPLPNPTTTIPLPPLTPLDTCQTQVFWNVAMSKDEQDWVVAIKFLGRQLSLCRPNRDLLWTNIQTPFGFSENSNLMFSKTDQRFYLPAPGGRHLFSYPLNVKQDQDPVFHKLQFRNLPQWPLSEWETLDSCCRTEYLVESASTGERFLLKWYGQADFKHGQGYKTMRFMVFREEEMLEGKGMCYTEDIGDTCIFLSRSEAFCVEASSFPGLKPNSIYYIGQGFGIYNLTTGTATPLQLPQGAPTALYWLPPFST